MKRRLFVASAAVLSFALSSSVSAATPAEVGLPADHMERALACIGVLMVSTSYAEDGTDVGYAVDE